MRERYEKTKHGVNASSAARYQCRAEAAEEREKCIAEYHRRTSGVLLDNWKQDDQQERQI